jgi:catechol 2,3-dioxygenase-like lactoylglutathione lyase family enzyme
MRESGFRVQQIDHVELFVPARLEAARWYREVLGLEVVEAYEHWAENPGGPLMISPDGGSTKLALFRGEPQASRETAGFHRVAFRVDGETFLGFLSRLVGIDVFDHTGTRVLSSSAVDHGESFSLYFSDPWGHRLEVTTYDSAEIRDRMIQ